MLQQTILQLVFNYKKHSDGQKTRLDSMMRSYTLVDPVSCIGSHNSDVIGKYRKCNSFFSNYLTPLPKNSLNLIHYSDNMTLGRSNTYIYMCKIATYLFRQAHRLLYSTTIYCYKLQYLFKAVRFCRVRKFPFGHRKKRAIQRRKNKLYMPNNNGMNPFPLFYPQ